MTTDTARHTIVTAVFSTPPSAYLRSLARRWTRLYGILLVMPVVAFAAIGMAIDFRFLIVALAVVFIIVPMLMTLLYYHYMLAPEARNAVLPKHVTIEPGKKILIVYADRGDGLRIPTPEEINWDDIARVRRSGRNTVFELNGRHLRLLLIPDNAIVQS